MRTHDHTSPGTGDCAPDPRLAALAEALHEAATQPGWRIENADFDARLILAALAEAGWTLAPTQSPVTNDPPPRLVTELYP